MNSAQGRESLLLSVVLPHGAIRLFPGSKVSLCFVGCSYGGLPLDFLSSALPLKSISYPSHPSLCDGRKQYRFCFSYDTNLFDAHQKAYQNSKPQQFSHAAQAGFHPTKRLKGITVPCQASCFLPTVLQMTACRSVDPRAC